MNILQIISFFEKKDRFQIKIDFGSDNPSRFRSYSKKNYLFHFQNLSVFIIVVFLFYANQTFSEENKLDTPIENTANEKPIEKKIAVIKGTHARQGLFSGFFTVLGYLDRFDKGELAGLSVDFADYGLYYEPPYGLNWWEYYCEPLRVGTLPGPEKSIEYCSDEEAPHVAYRTEIAFSRERSIELTQKYIKIKPSIQKEVDNFVSSQFNGKFVIGIHYRGTDKGSEAPRVPYEKVSEVVNSFIQNNESKDFLIFIATDEQPFVEFMQKSFPDKVICQNCLRSSDGKPIHFVNTSPYQQGKEAVIDCLLLSKTQTLLRTSSNLSHWSTFFNPNVPVIILSSRH